MTAHRRPPPRWTLEAIENDCRTALEAMVRRRLSEGGSTYRRLFAERRTLLAELFALSDDLLDLEPAAARREFREALRYVAGPPVSADDFKNLLTTLDGDGGRDPAAVASLLQDLVDSLRFPWIAQRQRPTEQERDSALRWTAGLWAVESTRTARRSSESREQEKRVRELIKGAGFSEKPKPGALERLDQLEIGSFTREALVAGTKCDVPVRLRDGRLLAIECKVSNSEVNSVKRLVREVGGKARQWQRVFGTQVLTAAVLRGVFKPANVLDAQDHYDVIIFWEHALGALEQFLGAAA